MKPATPEAIELMHRSTVALAQVEANGIKIDTKYLKQAIVKTDQRIAVINERLRSDPIYEIWRKRFGERTNLGSDQQLATVIFEELKYEERKERTKTGKIRAGKDALEHVDLPFVRDIVEVERLKKARGTNLKGLLNETTAVGRVHSNFHLNTAVTFRSSSRDPNIQNQPIRNEDISNLVRRSFIAPKGFRIGELDYKQIEVATAASQVRDPVLMEYVADSTKDMHRDMAMQIFKLPVEEIAKPVRITAKNGYVFPAFYGSYYLQCSKSIWETIDQFKLKTVSGVPLKKHLKTQGIRALGACDRNVKPERGTFEYHLKEIDEDFWKRRFKVYAEWKKSWWDRFLRVGSFRMMTGFVCRGELDRKQVCNAPIQGAAFHCLLWSLIHLQDWLNENHMRTRIIGEVHDSMILEFHEPELERVLRKAKKLMTQDIRQAWKWIKVPLAVEAEIAPLGGSWADKKPMEIPA